MADRIGFTCRGELTTGQTTGSRLWIGNKAGALMLYIAWGKELLHTGTGFAQARQAMVRERVSVGASGSGLQKRMRQQSARLVHAPRPRTHRCPSPGRAPDASLRAGRATTPPLHRPRSASCPRLQLRVSASVSAWPLRVRVTVRDTRATKSAFSARSEVRADPDQGLARSQAQGLQHDPTSNMVPHQAF